MELILWRHCDAKAGVPDELRPLSARGRAAAVQMAAWLAARLPATVRIIVSPAIRTQQTAAALARPFETDAGLAPGASVDAVLRAARWPDASQTTLIIGHEPTLGDVAAWLLGDESGHRPLRKGAVVWVAQHPAGEASAVLKFAASPESVGD
jgi:phosphohistidine phosphatase